MRILLLTRYSRMGASSRLRCLQYIPYLASQGVEVIPLSLFNDAYLNNLYESGRRRISNVLWCYWNRIAALLTQKRYHILWIQYELFPWLPNWIERLALSAGVPYVVDYDDAMFHAYNLNTKMAIRLLLKNKIEKIMRRADVVIAGNKYLENHAYQSGARRVEFVPTVIDMDRYRPNNRKNDSRLVIGWIGSPKTQKYLEIIKPAFDRFAKDKDVTLSLVGAGSIQFGNTKVKRSPWSEESEVRLINDFDIGIMPLSNSPWEQGKCGYKLIQYMACAKPVVASPVGANIEIVKDGSNGLLAGSTQDWIKAFSILHDNPELRAQMGQSGRDHVRNEYCLQVTGPRLLSIFKSIGSYN